jgi:hypothetical protein
MKFILTHRCALVPIKKFNMFRAVATQLQIKWSEVARSERELMIMMTDDDAVRLKHHMETEKVGDLSSDGELPIPRLHSPDEPPITRKTD